MQKSRDLGVYYCSVLLLLLLIDQLLLYQVRVCTHIPHRRRRPNLNPTADYISAVSQSLAKLCPHMYAPYQRPCMYVFKCTF